MTMIPLLHLHCFLLLLVVTTSSHPDLAPLLSFKSTQFHPAAAPVLDSWNSSTDPCSWKGINCNAKGRVDRLVLEGLRLAGPVESLTHLPYLAVLSLKNNSFSSLLHLIDFSPWRFHLKILLLSHNRFYGPFPTGILHLRHLRRLDLAGNRIYGAIPLNIGVGLPRLLTLRLECNKLNGTLSASLGWIKELRDLNVSHNHLSGQIPTRLSSFPPSSFQSNLKLCGRPLRRMCDHHIKQATERITVVIALAVFVSVILVAVVALILIRIRSRSSKMVSENRTEDKGAGKMVYFEGAREFTLEDLMRGSAEMLGRGSVGSTYRVVMEREREGERPEVVVKRVRRKLTTKNQAVAEEKLLCDIGRWRHANVVSLRACYFSRDELLLVSDYLPEGSLFDLLHGNRGPGRIPVEWSRRLNLALTAAEGMAFLHGASSSQISHGHLTSSNILVDSAGNACISDFALFELFPSKSLAAASSSTSSSDISPPRVINYDSLQKSDVYNFGIILLEILTGKPAENDTQMAKWVQTVVMEDWTSKVFDIELTRSKDAENQMLAMLMVALLCIANEPKNRPTMAVVYKMIEDIKNRGNRS